MEERSRKLSESPRADSVCEHLHQLVTRRKNRTWLLALVLVLTLLFALMTFSLLIISTDSSTLGNLNSKQTETSDVKLTQSEVMLSEATLNEAMLSLAGSETLHVTAAPSVKEYPDEKIRNSIYPPIFLTPQQCVAVYENSKEKLIADWLPKYARPDWHKAQYEYNGQMPTSDAFCSTILEDCWLHDPQSGCGEMWWVSGYCSEDRASILADYGGDEWHVEMTSATEKVSVRVEDLGSGLYRGQFCLQTGGVFRIRVRLLQPASLYYNLPYADRHEKVHPINWTGLLPPKWMTKILDESYVLIDLRRTYARPVSFAASERYPSNYESKSIYELQTREFGSWTIDPNLVDPKDIRFHNWKWNWYFSPAWPTVPAGEAFLSKYINPMKTVILVGDSLSRQAYNRLLILTGATPSEGPEYVMPLYTTSQMYYDKTRVFVTFVPKFTFQPFIWTHAFVKRHDFLPTDPRQVEEFISMQESTLLENLNRMNPVNATENSLNMPLGDVNQAEQVTHIFLQGALWDSQYAFKTANAVQFAKNLRTYVAQIKTDFPKAKLVYWTSPALDERAMSRTITTPSAFFAPRVNIRLTKFLKEATKLMQELGIQIVDVHYLSTGMSEGTFDGRHYHTDIAQQFLMEVFREIANPNLQPIEKNEKLMNLQFDTEPPPTTGL